MFFFFKQKTAYEMRISDWSSDVCSSDLWEFTPDARKLIQESESYAVLNRQAVLGFRSSYALKLYEIGSLRLHRRQSTWKGDMAALRAELGRSPDVYTDFEQTRRKVLAHAKTEIRTEERRVGQEGGRPRGSRWSPS